MSKLKVTAVSAFADNYIWLVHAPRAPQQVVAVDPGDAGPVERALHQYQLQLAAILVTHHHNDHVGGVERLHEKFAVPVYGPANEIIPGEPTPLREGAFVGFPQLGLEFAVLDIPGHTAGHIAYVGQGAVFCGDTLFSAGCGRLFEGTAAQMWTSLSKLAQLSADTEVYCAHEYTLSNLRFAQAVEPDNEAVAAHLQRCHAWRAEHRPTVPSALGLELNINPFLRVRQGTVKRAAEAHAGRTLDSELEVFAVLRDWKNHFQG